MLFTSVEFLLFFTTVYIMYALVNNKVRIQNLLLLTASYFFYGWWDWHYLFLIAGYTAISFFVGREIDRSNDGKKRKKLLAISVFSSLIILGFFKYFGFFVDSLLALFDIFGLNIDPLALQILLPVGISFYTFQTLSYTIDVYRGEIRHTNNIIDFALFVSFFPQLVAGPIERAKNLLPQIATPRQFNINQINAGIFLILWGVYKKLVIADNVAKVANEIFNNYALYTGLDIILGILAFTFQIYCDFSGYSDIARGLAKLMGFELMVNFKLPYFALNPSDFWQRWHISLSSWLRDYLYIPLGGNRHGQSTALRNLMITMLLGGLWHGAAWNFVIWGAYHGFILIIYRLWDSAHAVHQESRQTGGHGRFLIQTMSTVIMFILTMIGWVIFRSDSVAQINYMLSHAGIILSENSFAFLRPLLFYIAPLVAVQILQHKTRDLLVLTTFSLPVRIILYTVFLFMIFVFGAREQVEFIYFQF